MVLSFHFVYLSLDVTQVFSLLVHIVAHLPEILREGRSIDVNTTFLNLLVPRGLYRGRFKVCHIFLHGDLTLKSFRLRVTVDSIQELVVFWWLRQLASITCWRNHFFDQWAIDLNTGRWRP